MHLYRKNRAASGLISPREDQEAGADGKLAHRGRRSRTCRYSDCRSEDISRELPSFVIRGRPVTAGSADGRLFTNGLVGRLGRGGRRQDTETLRDGHVAIHSAQGHCRRRVRMGYLNTSARVRATSPKSIGVDSKVRIAWGRILDLMAPYGRALHMRARPPLRP